MYLEHFGLSEAPFRITPHTDFFFAGANRGATLDALIYAITHDEGIVKVSGEVGSGKTMLCRVLMERLPEKVTTIYLANPSLSRDDILYAIADELTLEFPENARTATVLRSLHTHLIESFGEGKQVVVLIDEAHAMPVETLEEIRLLSNLESNKHKLLQLVMFGQPELNAVLGRPDMRQLKERITHNFVLEPLIHEDISGYLDFRLRAAGYKGPNLFGADAVKLIAKASLGLTRRVNIIADKALLAAYSNGGHAVGPAEVAAAVKDCDFSESSFAKPKLRLPLIVGLVIVAALLIGIFVGGYFSTSPVAPEPAAKMAKEIVPSPVSSVPVTPAEPTANIAPASSPVSAPVALTTSAVPAPPNATLTAPNNAIAATMPTTASTSTAVAPAVPPAQKKDSPSALSANPLAPPVPSGIQTASADLKLGPLTLASVADGQAWLKNANDQHWFIQLLATDETRVDAVEMYLRRAQKANQLDQVRAYTSGLTDGTRIGVIFGDFESRDAAYAALKTLPNTLYTGKPYPRRVIRLR